MTRRCCVCFVVLAVAAGCGSEGGPSSDGPGGPPIGGQTGEETVGCLAVETRNLAWSERSALGFSADQLLRALGDQQETRLEWADGSSTRLSLTLARGAGAVLLEEREWTESRSGQEPAIALENGAEPATPQCNDVVSLPMTLGLTTSDGAFAEALPLRLLAESAARATAFLSLDTAELAGTFSVTEVDPAAYDEVLALFTLTFEAGAWSGSISGQAIDDGDGSPDGTASARMFEIGAF